MKLSIFATTVCLGLLQALPAQALARRSFSLPDPVGPSVSSTEALQAEISQDSLIAGRTRSRRTSKQSPRSSGRTPAKRRSSRQPSRRSPASGSKVSSPKSVSRPVIRRSRPKRSPARAQRRRIVKPGPSTPKVKPVVRTKPTVPKKATVRTVPKVTKAKPASKRQKTTPKVVQPTRKSAPQKSRVRAPVIRKPVKSLIRDRQRRPLVRPSKLHKRSPGPLIRYRVRSTPTRKVRRIVRRRRPIRYWGNRRVRTRRLTRSYRPCYYCPGVGWSYSSFCYTRPSRYYINSSRYSTLWPGIWSSIDRTPSLDSSVDESLQSLSDQTLAEKVEVAIEDYANLYELENLTDEITVTQEGSIIILAGETETEETLEDLVAIARDIDGVRYVVTDDVIVREPSTLDDESLLNLEDEPLLEPVQDPEDDFGSEPPVDASEPG